MEYKELWSYDEITEKIEDFLELYSKRPIKYNKGGMVTPHMFAIYFILDKINPSSVIESGVWRGQSTWLIENVLPTSKVFGIDINLSRREYISESAKYFNTDFKDIDTSEWDSLDKENTILFFDDHQDALERIKLCKKLGFKKIIIEDNYPINQGDCYSLKKIIDSKDSNLKYLEENLDFYYEFPPVYKDIKTRWGDEWGVEYPTKKPIFENSENKHEIFKKESQQYTWLCYIELN